MSRVIDGEAPRSQQETEIAIGSIANVEPSEIRGFAVLVDDGTRRAVVVSNLDGIPLLSLIGGVLEVLVTGERS